MIFTGVFAIIKAWLDEKIRRKITVVGTNYLKHITEYVDLDQIPVYLGGTNQAGFADDFGPWHEYELVDSQEPGAVVGIKRKGDITARVFTPTDFCALQNPVLDGDGA